MKTCVGTKKDGTPCTAKALGGSIYCFAHDPEREEERRAARSRGGHGSAAVVRIAKQMSPGVRNVYGLLNSAMLEVYSGSMDPKKAIALAQLARAVCAVVQTQSAISKDEKSIEQFENQLRDGLNANPFTDVPDNSNSAFLDREGT